MMGGAAVVAAVGVGGYVVSQRGGGAPHDVEEVDELMVSGPLGEMIMGDTSAPVTIIEYASMTCGHCAAFHTATMPALKSEFIDTGKAKLLFREYPLDPVATAASMVARCASKDAFFPLVDAMFQLQRTWAFGSEPMQGLMRVAQQAGFSQESFNACLQNQSVLDGVNWVKERAAKEFDVQSTPTFFVNGEMVRGNLPIEEFRQKIDGALTS